VILADAFPTDAAEAFEENDPACLPSMQRGDDPPHFVELQLFEEITGQFIILIKFNYISKSLSEA